MGKERRMKRKDFVRKEETRGGERDLVKEGEKEGRKKKEGRKEGKRRGGKNVGKSS